MWHLFNYDLLGMEPWLVFYCIFNINSIINNTYSIYQWNKLLRCDIKVLCVIFRNAWSVFFWQSKNSQLYKKNEGALLLSASHIDYFKVFLYQARARHVLGRACVSGEWRSDTKFILYLALLFGFEVTMFVIKCPCVFLLCNNWDFLKGKKNKPGIWKQKQKHIKNTS